MIGNETVMKMKNRCFTGLEKCPYVFDRLSDFLNVYQQDEYEMIVCTKDIWDRYNEGGANRAFIHRFDGKVIDSA